MKKAETEMRAAYKRSDFAKLERGKFFAEASKGTAVALIEPQLAKAFPTSEAVNEALRGLLAALSMYRTDHLHRTRDVLRDLYQGLVPGKLRQSLGEFYNARLAGRFHRPAGTIRSVAWKSASLIPPAAPVRF